MRKNRFVSTETVKYELPAEDGFDADWIVVKKQLSHGEQQKLMASMIGKVPAALMDATKRGDLELSLDVAGISTERMLAWLVDWSFEADGEKMPLGRDSIDGLDSDTAAEIDTVLVAHIEALDGEKKVTSGSNGRVPR